MSVISIVLNTSVERVLNDVKGADRAVAITISNQHHGGTSVRRVMTPEDQNKIDGIVHEAIELLSQEAIRNEKSFFSLEVRAQFVNGQLLSTGFQPIQL